MKQALLAAALLLAIPAAASAHAFLKQAVPAVGSTVHSPPQTLLLTFTEGVEPAFTSVVVKDAAGANQTSAAPQRAGGDPRQLTVPLKPLAAGTYTVEWHATAVDTHKTEGRFTFTVAP